jgi:hypothetical protein
VITSTTTSTAQGYCLTYIDGELTELAGFYGEKWKDGSGPTYSYVAQAGKGATVFTGGRVAEISIWNKVLSAAEVLSISAEGDMSERKPVDLTALGSLYTDHCVHYWKMGADLTDNGSSSASSGGSNDMTAEGTGASSVADYPW